MSAAAPFGNLARFTVEELVQATGGVVREGAVGPVQGVFTDTRAPVPGGLFVPLSGERFDGHDYLGAAVAGGARLVLVARGRAAPAGVGAVEVDDPLQALGGLAAFHRRRFSVALAGITGSVGKTSAKNLVGAVVSGAAPALVTLGNLNNLVGVPMTLLGLTAEHRFAVIEMGTNRPGEIARLAEIAQPRVGLITRIGSSHLEGLGTLDGVQTEKGALFTALGGDGVGVVNLDDPRVVVEASRLGRRITYGIAADVRLVRRRDLGVAGAEIHVATPSGEVQTRLHLLGEHQIHNALAATATCIALGVATEVIARGLEQVRPAAGRMQAVKTGRDVLVLDDTYNANPDSMRAAFATLVSLAGTSRRLAVVGEMLELGGAGIDAHREVGRVAAGSGLAALLACGPSAGALAEAAIEAGMSAGAVHTFPDAGEAAQAAIALSRPGDAVLVKGSRGMRMEQVVAALGGAVH